MFLINILQQLFLLQGGTTGGGPDAAVVYDCARTGGICMGSTFTALAAAFQTEGMFVQSDMIHYLLYGDIGLYAPLLYMLSAFGGMVGVAIGMPPKTYVWFFLGPAFYHWLIATPYQVSGTEWQVAGFPQDQREVWKLAEVGLVNSNIVKRLGIEVSRSQAPGELVDVAMPFVWYDSVVSDTVQWLIKWTGVYSQLPNAAGSGGGTNINERPDRNLGSYSFDDDPSITPGGPKWHLLSNLKWTFLEGITASMLHTADLRDAFVTFLSSECGDTLSQHIDIDSFVAARNARGQNLPLSIFTGTASTADYEAVLTRLKRTEVPVPQSLRNFVQKRYRVTQTGGASSDREGFASFFDPSKYDAISLRVIQGDSVSCKGYFELLMNGFRWEAGHSFHQLVTSHRPYIKPGDIIYSLFYGWDIKGCGAPSSQANSTQACDTKDQLLSTAEQTKYLQDLILVHMIRNELRIAPRILFNPRYSEGTKAQEYAQTQMRTIGQKQKYGEVYAWSLLVPKVQGVLLYVLAMGYPFACVLIVVPGWHKTIFTWMSFWAWAKLWDVGFAIVQVIERSVWAMNGTTADAKGIADRVMDLQYWSNIDVRCPNGASNFNDPLFACAVPSVCDVTCGTASETSPGNLLKIFDRGVVLSNSLDLDLANSYYIYIMGALYMSVPAVTGQLVLGAKAGAAGLVNSMIGGVAGEAGRAVGSAYSSDMTQKVKSDGAAVAQTGYMKGLRGNGLTLQAMDAGNRAADMDAFGALNSGMREAFDQRQRIMENNAQSLNTAFDSASVAAEIAGSPRRMAQAAAIGGLAAAANKLPAGSKERALAEAATAAAVLAPGMSGSGGAGGGGGGGGNPFLSLAKNAANQAYAAASSGLQANRADSSLAAGYGQAVGRGYGSAQQRLGALGHFYGENQAWHMKNDYATAASGDLGAMGINAGVLDPGPKPLNFEGAAMAGMLGGDVKASAEYTAGPGHGFFNNIQSSHESMKGILGSDAGRALMNSSSAYSAINQGALGFSSSSPAHFMAMGSSIGGTPPGHSGVVPTFTPTVATQLWAGTPNLQGMVNETKTLTDGMAKTWGVNR